MDTIKDTYFKQNATGVALVEFFWGLGFPVILESTFLQIFLKNIGASDFMIGMVPSILIIGISIFPLLSSYFGRNHEQKKMIVLYLHLISSLSTLLFGLFLFFTTDTTIILPVFFISYIIFSFCIGLTFPVWLHFLVKIFSEKNSVKGLGIMYTAQNIAKIIASIFILKVIETYSFSLYSAAWIFLLSGVLFLVGSICFLFTKELPPDEEPVFINETFFAHSIDTIMEMVRNKNLIKYLIGDLDNYVLLTIISFYANYATQFFGIKDYTAAGLFVIFIFSGSIVSNIIFGTMGFLSLKNKYLSTKALSLVSILILIYLPTLSGFLLASFLMGICRGTRGMIYSPAIKKFCDRDDTTGYFAVAPLLTIVFGSGFPAFFGLMLDYNSHLGSTAYKIMFAVSFGLVCVTLIVGFFTDFNKKLQKQPLKIT